MSSAQKTPDKGLEPLTLGLKVPRSTDWANRAYLWAISYKFNNYKHWRFPILEIR